MRFKELANLYWLRREIELDKERLLELEASMGLAGYDPSKPKVMNGSPDNAVENLIERMETLREKIARKQQRCADELVKLEEFIETVDDSLIRQIIILRFERGLSWNKVAHTIGGLTGDSARMLCKRFLDKK